jgi:hypothetical protein
MVDDEVGGCGLAAVSLNGGDALMTFDGSGRVLHHPIDTGKMSHDFNLEEKGLRVALIGEGSRWLSLSENR